MSMRIIRGMMRAGLCLTLSLGPTACDSKKKKADCAANDATCQADGGSDAGEGPGSPDAGGVDGPRAVTKGRVFDAERASVLAGVTLSLSADTATSDKQGAFEIGRAPTAKEGSLDVERDGYVPAARAAPPGGGYLELFLKKVDKRVPFRGDEGVSMRLPSGAGIDIPAGAVVDSKGKKVAGTVTLELAEIDGRVRTQAAALPGDGHGRMLDKTAGLISPELALSIRILDGKANELTVTKAAEVTAWMPAGRADAPFTERVYSFDEASAQWVEESTASQLTRDGVRAYRVAVEHLSWWSIGRFSKATTCVRACVEDAEGAKVSGAQVWVVGASRAGVSSFFTDDKGCGATDVIAKESVVLVAQSEGATSEPKKVATGSEGVSAAKDAGACTNAGTLVLKAAKPDACPQGFAVCGKDCVDLASDVLHCGTCDNACEADQRCVIDACETPSAERIAVRGKVVDRYGSPWVSVPVQIGDEMRMTDGQGAFSFDDVATPYDLRIDQGDPKVFIGVTRPDPEFRDGIQSGSTGSLRGTVTGAGIPLATDHELNVTFVAPSSTSFNHIRRAGQNGAWGPSTFRWSPRFPTLDGVVFAVQHNELTDAFTGMGSTTFSLPPGGSLTGLDIVLAPVTVHPVAFEIDMPKEMTFDNYDLSVGLFSRIVSLPPDRSFSLDVPDDLPQQVLARFIVRGSVDDNTSSVIRYFGSDVRSVRVELPVPGRCVSPPDGAVDVKRSANLTFTRPFGATVKSDLSWSDASGDQQGVSVYTDATSVSFARLAAIGITPMPMDGSVFWQLRGEGPAGDVDEALDPARPPLGDSVAWYGQSRTFTLAP